MYGFSPVCLSSDAVVPRSADYCVGLVGPSGRGRAEDILQAGAPSKYVARGDRAEALEGGETFDAESRWSERWKKQVSTGEMKEQQSDRVKNFAQSMDDEKRKERYGAQKVLQLVLCGGKPNGLYAL